MIIVTDLLMYTPIAGNDIPTMILFIEFMRRMYLIVRLFIDKGS